MPQLYINTKKGRLPFTVEDVFEVSAGRKASNGFSLPPKDGKSSRDRLLDRLTDENGEPVSNTRLTGIFSEAIYPEVEEQPEKLFLTLTDVADAIASLASDTDTMDKYYEDALKNPNIPEDKKKIYKKNAEEWEAEKKRMPEPTGYMAPVSKALQETLGNNLDLADVALAFTPVGAVTRGAGLVGRGLTKVQKIGSVGGAISRGATNLLKHPVITDVAEQTLLEGAHNFTDPTQTMGEAAANTLLAGGTSGLADVAGAWRINRAANSKEGRKIRELMDESGMTPRFSNFDQPVLETPAQRIRYALTTTAPLQKELKGSGSIDADQLGGIISRVNEEFRTNGDLPSGLRKQFQRPYNEKLGEEGLSSWEESFWDKLPSPKDGKYSVADVYNALYSDIPVDRFSMIDPGEKAIVGREGTYDPGVEALGKVGEQVDESANETAMKLLEKRKDQQWLREARYPERGDDLTGFAARPFNAAARRWEGRLNPETTVRGIPIASPGLFDVAQDVGVGMASKKLADEEYRPVSTLLDVANIPSEIWGMTTNKISEAASEAADKAVSEAMKKYIGK